MNRCLIILLSLCFTPCVIGEDLQTFLNEYCVRCHGEGKQKGDRRFDQVGNAISGLESAEHFQEILDQLNLAEMPPEDEEQPSDETLKQVVSFLTASLAKAREEGDDNGGQVMMRRLNRSEYLNTVRDLFSLTTKDFDPTTTFPEDDSVEGFDNNGSGLVASDYPLQNYLEAARTGFGSWARPTDIPTTPFAIRFLFGSSQSRSSGQPGSKFSLPVSRP